MCPAVPTTSDRMSPPSPAAATVARLVAVPIRAVLRLGSPSIVPRLERTALPSARPEPSGASAPAPSGPSVPAHYLQDLAQPQVDLPALHVHTNHLHFDAIAKAVDASVLLAAQDVRALDEPVVVVGHRRDVHHPFDEMLDELDVEAEGAHARDVPVELVADFVGHEP